MMFLHLLKKNMNKQISIKSYKQSMLLLYISVSSKVKNHYDTLGVSTNATHNEIKSAYYDLTLKYHPDKNKSAVAKQMFQAISDAYNVIGKYESRKRYDRTILVKRGPEYSTKRKKRYAPEHEYYHNVGRIYNFDKWMNAHYTAAFARNLQIRNEQKTSTSKRQDNNIIHVTMLCAMFGMTATLMLYKLVSDIIVVKEKNTSGD